MKFLAIGLSLIPMFIIAQSFSQNDDFKTKVKYVLKHTNSQLSAFIDHKRCIIKSEKQKEMDACKLELAKKLFIK